MRGTLIVVGVMACAKAPEPTGELASTRSANVSSDGARHVVTFGDATLVFAPTSQIEMPESLTITGGGDNVFGQNTGCQLENRVGVATFPFALAMPGTADGAAVASELTVDIAGPAIAKVSVNYTVGYDCDDMQELSGTTVFTFLPSNRIVRQDIGVQPASENLTRVCSNQCSSNSYFFTSFWTFDDPEFVDAGNNPVPVSAPRELCAMRAEDGVALVWGDRPGFRSRIMDNAVTVDFAVGATLDADAVDQTSTIVIGTDMSCAELLAATEDPAILVNGVDITVSPDGVYETGTGLGTVRITATAEMPRGFALLLSATAKHIAARRADGTPVRRAATNHNDKTVVWIDDPLAAGETITLEVDE